MDPYGVYRVIKQLICQNCTVVLNLDGPGWIYIIRNHMKTKLIKLNSRPRLETAVYLSTACIGCHDIAHCLTSSSSESKLAGDVSYVCPVKLAKSGATLHLYTDAFLCS